jgi:hypothetical protein
MILNFNLWKIRKNKSYERIDESRPLGFKVDPVKALSTCSFFRPSLMPSRVGQCWNYGQKSGGYMLYFMNNWRKKLFGNLRKTLFCQLTFIVKVITEWVIHNTGVKFFFVFELWTVEVSTDAEFYVDFKMINLP